MSQLIVRHLFGAIRAGLIFLERGAMQRQTNPPAVLLADRRADRCRWESTLRCMVAARNTIDGDWRVNGPDRRPQQISRFAPACGSDLTSRWHQSPCEGLTRR